MPSAQLVVWGIKIGDKFGAQVANYEGGFKNPENNAIIVDVEILEREGIITAKIAQGLKDEGYRLVNYVVGDGKPYPALELEQKRVGKEFGG